MDSELVDQAVVAGVSLVATMLATPLIRRMAVAVGAVKVPGERHIHAKATPELGGLAILIGLVAAYAVATRLETFDPVFRTTSEPEAILLAALIITFVGVLDDTRSLSPAAKLAGQVMAAGTLVLFGVTLRFVYVPFAGGNIVSLSPDASALVTILAVVAMINAVNLVDGLDGLAAGIVAIAAFALFAYAELTPPGPIPVEFEISAAALILCGVFGACLGFLVFNFNPASIFMGDTGSMLLGLLLAASGVSAIGNTLQPTSTDFFAASVPALIPALVLAIPFIDTSLAIIRRLVSGQSIAIGDKKHLHHRLVEVGHSVRRAVIILYLCSALLAFVVVGPSVIDPRTVTFVGIGGVVALALYSSRLLVLDGRRTRAIDRSDNVRRHEKT